MRALGGAALLVWFASGCIGDKSADLAVPATLAVDAFGAFSFGDKCVGSKADLCSRERIRSIDVVTVNPPGFVEVVPTSAVPAELLKRWNYTGDSVVHGLVPGRGELCVEGTFSDGSHRKDCHPMRVDKVGKLALELVCETRIAGKDADPLVSAGAVLQFAIEPSAADGTSLGGYVLNPIDEAGLEPLGAPMAYLWRSPPNGGSLTLTSPVLPTFSKALSTYGPSDVTSLAVSANLIPPTVLVPGLRQEFQVMPDVRGLRACQGLPVEIRSETPEICGGPSEEASHEAPHEASWESGPLSSFTALREGTCRLSIGLPGSAAPPVPLSVPFYFLSAADQGRDATIGSPCQGNGARTCVATRQHSLICNRAGKWELDASCNGLLCDYTSPAPCTAGASCVTCR